MNVSYSAVSELTPAIKAAAQEPFRFAFAKAGGTVFLVPLAFSGNGINLSRFIRDNHKTTENFVAGNFYGNDYQLFAAFQDLVRWTLARKTLCG